MTSTAELISPPDIPITDEDRQRLLEELNKKQTIVEIISPTDIPLSEDDLLNLKGGAGSGFFGHAGRPGLIGGSIAALGSAARNLYQGFIGSPSAPTTATELDKRLVDYKPDRSLSDPEKTQSIISLLNAPFHTGAAHNARLVHYSQMPFLDKLHAAMGVRDASKIPIEKYVKLRDEFFSKLPIEDVPLDYIVATQEFVNRERVHQIREHPETTGGKQPYLVRYDGETYVINGHNRIAAEVLNFKPSVKGHVWDLGWEKQSADSELKGGEGSGNFGHRGRPGLVGGSSPSDSTTVVTDESTDAEVAAPSKIKIGQPFLVYRLGGSSGKLENRNGANSLGLAHFIEQSQDYESPVGGGGDTVHVFRVILRKPFEEYATYNRGLTTTTTNSVGRNLRYRGAVNYSFPSETAGAYSAELLGSISLVDLGKRLADKHGERYFGISVWGDDVIREWGEEQVRKLKTRKQLINSSETIYGVTAGALMQPDALADEGPGTPHPITGIRYSSTQFNLPFDIALRVKEIGTELIPDEDLSTEVKDVVGGREMLPHITIKYGIHAEYPDDVEEALKGVAPVEVTIGDTFIFESDKDYDVVNLKIVSPALVKLNKIISESTEVTDTQPKYVPHCCLAYVKKGTGKKYDGIKTELSGQTVVLDTVLFSSRNGEEFFIPLSEVVHEDKGGVGSGFYDHSGRPGLVGGSVPSASTPNYSRIENGKYIRGDSWEVTDSSGRVHKFTRSIGEAGFKETLSGPYPDEYQDLVGYTSFGYKKVNAALRDGSLTSVPLLDGLISRNTIDQDAQLYRVIGGGLEGFSVGDEFTDKAFVSTTWNKRVAERVLQEGVIGTEATAQRKLMVVNIKAGQSAFSVDEFEGGVDDIHSYSEKEYLLPRGLKFRVDKVDDRGTPTEVTVTK